jgi:nicotinamidase/pyrazinamidase
VSSSNEETDEAIGAELLQLVAAGRPEHLARLAVEQLPEPARLGLAQITELFASLALYAPAPPQPTSSGLRDRILASARKRIEQKPKRALLVIDMLNDHLEEGGPLEVPRARAIVPALQAKLDEARREGVPVVYIVDEHEADDPDLDIWRAHNVRGTHGAAVWPAIAPSEGDRVVRKQTYSAFVGSELEAVLADLSVETLVLTGCLTEIGLHATAVDALQRGYAVEVPEATQAGVSEATEHVTLAVLRVLQPFGPTRRDLLRRVRPSVDRA